MKALTSQLAGQGFRICVCSFEPPPENPPVYTVGNQVHHAQGLLGRIGGGVCGRPRLTVARRFGVGWTLNFGDPKATMLVAGVVALIGLAITLRFGG